MGKVDDRGSVSCRNMSFLGKVLRYTDPIETKEMKLGNSMEARAISNTNKYKIRFTIVYRSHNVDYSYVKKTFLLPAHQMPRFHAHVVGMEF